MRILVVMPTAQGVYPPEAEERRVRTVLSYSTAGTQVEVGFPDTRSPFTPMRTDGGGEATAEELNFNHAILGRRMIQAEEQGYDACVPFGMIDFGIDIARSRCNIPIIGQTHAALAIASNMASRFGLITYRSSGHPAMRRRVYAYGFEHMVAGWGAAEMPNAQMPARRVELFERFVSEGKRLVREGAELIICAGMSMSPIEYPAQDYADAIGVPVLEGLGCGIAMAEAWVRLGTPYSRVRHPSPTGASTRS